MKEVAPFRDSGSSLPGDYGPGRTELSRHRRRGGAGRSTAGGGGASPFFAADERRSGSEPPRSKKNRGQAIAKETSRSAKSMPTDRATSATSGEQRTPAPYSPPSGLGILGSLFRRDQKSSPTTMLMSTTYQPNSPSIASPAVVVAVIAGKNSWTK